MIFLRGPSSKIALGSVILLVMSSMGGAGLSTWKEAGNDFMNGTKENVSLGSGILGLGVNGSFSNNWTLESSGAPSPRVGQAMAYDSANGEVVMFGGLGPHGDLCDTWIYRFGTNKWTNMNPPTAPSAYGDTISMAYDSASSKVVLFVGNILNSTFSSTWTYDPTTNQWTNQNPLTEPPARSSQAMAYDSAHNKLVLFGGWNAGDLGDTWTYDLDTNLWTNMNPSIAPTPRFGGAMVYDYLHDEVVLFGGRNFDVYNETWAYNLSTNIWTNRNPSSSPPQKVWISMACDSGHDKLVLFGGQTQTYNNFIALNDTWTYDLRTNNWTIMNPSAAPSARNAPSMAYDSAHDKVVLFGGNIGGPTDNLDDTWSYDINTNNWMKMNPPIAPPQREYHAMVYASAHGEVVLFGGLCGYSPYYLNDTWTYNLSTNNWTNMYPSIAPSVRAYCSMAYDSVYDEVVLFGGDDGYHYLNDTWIYNFTTNNWTNMVPLTSPSAVEGSAMAYNNAHGEVVLFGGWDGNKYFGDTWTYDKGTNNWIDMNPSTAPPPRAYSAMAYDCSHDEAILFGGATGNNSNFNDTWKYDISMNKWTYITPQLSPPARNSHAMVYDSVHSEIVLYGGLRDSGFLNDTWTYNLTTNDWANLNPPTTPQARSGHAMVYDSSSGRVVLFGGYWNNVVLDDTWMYVTRTYLTIGKYTSTPVDTGGTAYFGTISWDANMPHMTTLRFQFRSANTIENLNSNPFIGPDGTANSYYTVNDSQINSVNNGTRWFQYRAYFGTNDVTVTPVLRSIKVNYNLLQSVELLSPVGGENWTGNHNITWATQDGDNDNLSFDIYLENDTGSTLLAGGLPNETRDWVWNTSAIPNGTYRIKMVARDDNPSIPLIVNATSGDFTIFHPLPNHPPHVELRSPTNDSIVNASSVRLSWIGTDPDGDPLTFTVEYSNRPLSEGNGWMNITRIDYLDLTNLTDNTTYYWTVDASDPMFNTTDVPVGVWSFTVQLPHPPVNNPPRITSHPPTEVTVGDEFYYNLTATDADGDTLAYSLVASPQNLSIDSSSGRIQWLPSTDDVGNHTVVVQVSDGRGGVDLQTFTITVSPRPISPAPEKPQCVIVYPINGSKVGGRIIIRGTAINGTLPLTIIQVRIDDSDWVTAIGLKNWTLSVNMGQMKNGGHTIKARAFDGSLYSDTASTTFTVANPEPSVSSGGTPWCLPAVLIAVVAGLGILLVLRKKKGGPPAG